MPEMPIVSVIMMFLNAEKFIDASIRTVLEQTYQNWELLLIDDGSVDGSTQIAINYTIEYPEKIKYFEHENHQNKGLSATRNLGIRHAKGEFIAFLDSDDIWFSNKLEEQIKISKSYPQSDMIYGSVLMWYSWLNDNPDAQSDREVPQVGHQDTLIKPPTLIPHLLLERSMPFLGSALIRKKAILHLDGFVDSFKGYYDDQVFLVKLLLKSKVYAAGKCWVKYRQHDTSACHSWSKDGTANLSRITFLKWIEKYFSIQGYKSTDIWKILQNELTPFGYRLGWRWRLLEKLDNCYYTVQRTFWRTKRMRLGKSTGLITACPNPVPHYDGLGSATLKWESIGTKLVEVHVDFPDGPLFSRTNGSGQSETGNWIFNGRRFYLQDVSDGLQLSKENTLDMIRVFLTSKDLKL